MTRRTRPGRRTLALLLRDARGRFMRVLPTLAELAAEAAAKRRHRRGPANSTYPCPIGTGAQLALF
jgi:hypothetical protein